MKEREQVFHLYVLQVLCERAGWKPGANLANAMRWAVSTGITYEQFLVEMIGIGIYVEPMTFESAGDAFNKELAEYYASHPPTESTELFD